MRRGLFTDRKFYVFVGLLVLLVLVNLNQWRGYSTAVSVSTQEKAAMAKPTSGDPVLLAEKLTTEKTEFQQEKRNIFSFFQNSPPPETLSMQQSEPAPLPEAVCGNGACEPGEDLDSCAADCQPPPPPAPVIALRYIGFTSRPSGAVVFLTDGKEVYMGRVNDVIANQYRVLKITEDAVELGFLNNNQSSTIRFQGNQGD